MGDVPCALLKELECPICLETCKTPIVMCVNSHHFCSSCVNADLCSMCPRTLTKCPICNVAGKLKIRDRFSEQFLAAYHNFPKKVDDTRSYSEAFGGGTAGHKCGKCSKDFFHRSDCLEHEKTCAPLRCPGCKKIYKLKKCLLNHVRSTVVEKLKCKRCCTKFTNKRALLSHKVKCNEPLRCATCGESFARFVDLAKHVKLY